MIKDTRIRQQDVLSMIVKRYVETAEPIGSRYVARRLGLSSATIRNVMADLEEAGFITHPHTSAGRVPTDKGYRYYIESLMRVKRVDEHAIKAISEYYTRTVRSLEEIMEKTSHLISGLTNYVGIALNSEYDKLYLGGTSHMLTVPEFSDLKKLYTILRSLEEKRDIFNLLNDDLASENLAIHIGRENRFGYLRECSIVTGGYKRKGKISGRLGVIGPKRMVYEKIIPMVEFLSDTVTRIIEESEI